MQIYKQNKTIKNMEKHPIGHQDNPLSKTGKLFSDNLLICFNGGIDKVKRETDLNLVELHFQLYEEVPSGKRLKILEDYCRKVRKMGIELVAHCPFMKDKNKKGEDYRELNIDFVWPLVPQEFKKKLVSELKGNKCFLKKASIKKISNFLEILKKLGIRVLTMHVSKPGVWFNKKDFGKLLKILEKIKKIADRNEVKIAIETGGILEEEISKIIGLGFGINFDTAHYFLDLHMKGKNIQEANKETAEVFKRVADRVYVIHLSQTTLDYDAHLNSFDSYGVLTCNEEILRYTKKKTLKPYVILETHPDKKGIDIVRKILD